MEADGVSQVKADSLHDHSHDQRHSSGDAGTDGDLAKIPASPTTLPVSFTLYRVD